MLDACHSSLKKLEILPCSDEFTRNKNPETENMSEEYNVGLYYATKLLTIIIFYSKWFIVSTVSV